MTDAHCTMLTFPYLDISFCRYITDAGIMSFTDKFAGLTELNIARTKISAQGLKHIVTYAPRLEKLCKYSNSQLQCI